jgi:ATP-dependent Clp protease protease subunit
MKDLLKDVRKDAGIGEVFSLLVPNENEDKVLPSVEAVLEWKEIKERRLVINEIVTDGFLFYSQLIIQWNKEDKDNNLKLEERKPIKILLNTVGGDLDACQSFYNIIQISKTPVYIYNVGLCASAGALIFLSGHKRFAVKGSKFLIHEGEVGLQGQTTKVLENLEQCKKVEKEIEDYILSKTKIDKKLYNKNKKKEWWITTEAVELGIADAFVEDLEELL